MKIKHICWAQTLLVACISYKSLVCLWFHQQMKNNNDDERSKIKEMKQKKNKKTIANKTINIIHRIKETKSFADNKSVQWCRQTNEKNKINNCDFSTQQKGSTQIVMLSAYTIHNSYWNCKLKTKGYKMQLFCRL